MLNLVLIRINLTTTNFKITPQVKLHASGENRFLIVTLITNNKIPASNNICACLCSLIKMKLPHNVWAQFDVMVSIKTLQFETNFISELTIILPSGLKLLCLWNVSCWTLKTVHERRSGVCCSKPHDQSSVGIKAEAGELLWLRAALLVSLLRWRRICVMKMWKVPVMQPRRWSEHQRC